jgi:hypothetical protein
MSDRGCVRRPPVRAGRSRLLPDTVHHTGGVHFQGAISWTATTGSPAFRPRMDGLSASTVRGMGLGSSRPGWSTSQTSDLVAPDLQDGLDLATPRMADHATAVCLASEGAGALLHTVLCRWSVGGLVALTATNTPRPAARSLAQGNSGPASLSRRFCASNPHGRFGPQADWPLGKCWVVPKNYRPTVN